MKIKQIVFGSLFIALLVGCSVQSKVVEKPKLQPEKEVSIVWKDTLDEGILYESDREEFLSQLNLKVSEETEIVENENENDSEMESVESVEANADEIEAVEQATPTNTNIASESVASGHSQTQTTVASKPTQTQPKNQEQASGNSQNSGSNNQVVAPKPTPIPKEPDRKLPAFVYEVGNSGMIFDTYSEGWGWADKKLFELVTKDPHGYSGFMVRSYYVDDNSPEKWTVDFE